MSWFSKLLKKLAGTQASDLLLVKDLAIAGEAFNGALEPDECYIELYVEAVRLEHERKFAQRFHGVVYSFVEIARLGEGRVQLAAASKPDKIAELDPNSLHKVITLSKQMMGAVPWRGGQLDLQLGLFSVKSTNLLSPIVDFVTQISSVAGISFVGQVAPFVPLINKGMDIIAGQTDDTALEVALDTSFSLTKAGVFAIIEAKKGDIDPARITIDPIDHKLLVDGQPLKRSYCVFSIRRADQKPDFGAIPELKEKYAAISAAIRANNMKDASDALTAFRLATLASPDLIEKDAARLAAKAEATVRSAFPAGGVSKGALEAYPSELADIDLYGS